VALLHVTLEEPGLRAEAIVKVDHQLFAHLARDAKHLLSLFGIEGHRLFTEHVQPRPQRGHRHRSVQVVGHRHAHRVEAALGEHLLIVGVGICLRIHSLVVSQPLLVEIA